MLARCLLLALLLAAAGARAAPAGRPREADKRPGIAQARGAHGDDADCPVCEYLVVLLKQQLDPATEQAAIERAEQACAALPGDLRQQCQQYVAQAGKALFQWMEAADPASICSQLGMCAAADAQPLWTPALQGELAALRPAASNDEEQCNTCQLVVVEASAVLSDPATQKQILEYVKQSCQDFEAFADQCASYVDLYGPTVLALARQYLNPQLCTTLGFCSAAAAAA